MESDDHRTWVLGRLRIYLLRKRSPRFTLGLIMMLTGLVGFLSSMFMLKLGLTSMGFRYLFAVLVAWGAFLLQVRVWAEFQRGVISEDERMLGPARKGEQVPRGHRSLFPDGLSGGRDRSWFDWIEIPWDLESLFAGFGVLLIILLVGGVLLAISGVILQAEVLLAELLLDTVLVTAFYRRLRGKDPEWWLHGMLRHTVGPVAVTAFCLLIAGFALQLYAPDARSIGGVWKHAHTKAPDPRQVEVEAP